MTNPRPNPTGGPPERLASWNSPLSIFGLWIVLIGFLLLVTFGLFTLVSPTSNPYLDIFTFLGIPGIIVFGFLVATLGVAIRRWQIHKIDPERKFRRFPRLDLNDPRQRRSVSILGGCVLVMVPVVAVTSYHGYHYTDSVAFCAEACHEVMHPEGTAYEFSSHARVTCAECHIGAGASWFVRSKISGLRQVLAVLADSYSRPIPPAIHHLRPAADTCEQCHWPKKFHGAQLLEIAHFATDEANTRHEMRILVKTGGGDDVTGHAEGIHMHMVLSGRMEYVATDPYLQEIPWVRWVGAAGETHVFRADGLPAEAPPPEGQLRTIDCMDCHNRPAHKFVPPRQSVDLFLERGRIDRTLPFIKKKAVEVLTASYPDPETARRAIANDLTDYYRTAHPEVWSGRRPALEEAIERTQEIYDLTFFPEMNVDWKTYPDNIGHLEFPGCFRCHDGKHVDREGHAVRRECDICHDFLNPVVGEGEAGLVQKGEFRHAYPLRGVHAELLCHRCHDGGQLSRTCTGCHSARAGEAASEGVLTKLASGCASSGCHTDVARAKFVHVPVAQEMCDSCHRDRTAGAHDFAPMSESGEVCTSCHGAFTGDVVHGPVQEGRCTFCHSPHGSSTEKLLVAASPRDLCVSCHPDPAAGRAHPHPPAEDDCLLCHDPHASGRKGLVRDDERKLCTSCHTDVEEGIADRKHAHAPVEAGCTPCHEPHGSDTGSMLARPAPLLCLECHADVGEAVDGAKVPHPPVSREADCGTCHAPHAADADALLTSEPETLCLACHGGEAAAARGAVDMKKLLEERPYRHGPAGEGDCLACHGGHGGENFALLASAYPESLYSAFSEEAYALCFTCHDADLVKEERTETATEFRDGDRNLHTVHVAGRTRGRSCRACHDPHAAENPNFVRETVPYGDWKMKMNFEATPTGGSCAPGCHQAYRYDRVDPAAGAAR